MATYNKKEYLKLIAVLAGCEQVTITTDRFEGNVEYTISGVLYGNGFLIQSIGFEITLAELLDLIYDTDSIDFSTNAAIIYG